MTMRGRELSEMPPETAAIGEKVLKEDDPYRVIGEQLADILADEEFAGMYEATGRNAIWPSVLAMVTLFQFQESVPDREAARMVATRIDWKYALRLPLDYEGFDFSVLCDFRRRILEHGEEALLFEVVLEKVRALGFVRKRGKARTDSTAVLGAVRALSLLETVTETLRVAVRAIERAEFDWAEGQLPASFRERYARTRPDYRLSREEREAALLEAGRDGLWLLERTQAGPGELRGLEELRLLGKVLEQRYELAGGKVALREQAAECAELVVTPHDAGVRIGEKRGRQWMGEKAHVSETAEESGPNFITDVTTANASGGDADSLPEIRGNLSRRDVAPGEQYVDAGYVSGKALAESEGASILLLGPPLEDTSKQEFKIAAFEIDRAARRAVCPGGKASVGWNERTEPDGSRAAMIQFSSKDCTPCPLRSRCTTAKRGRRLHLGEHYERVEARRAEARTEAFQKRMHSRAAIEATLSELVRAHGFRRHRYRGDAKRSFENLLKGAACNLKRLVRALLGRRERAPGREQAPGRGQDGPQHPMGTTILLPAA